MRVTIRSSPYLVAPRLRHPWRMVDALAEYNFRRMTSVARHGDRARHLVVAFKALAFVEAKRDRLRNRPKKQPS